MRQKNKINILIAVFILIAMSIFVYAEETLRGKESPDFRTNAFTDNDNKLGMIIPAIMLIVVIVAFSIDFGAVAVNIGAILSLIILYMLKVIYIDFISLISLIVMIGMLAYKIQQT